MISNIGHEKPGFVSAADFRYPVGFTFFNSWFYVCSESKTGPVGLFLLDFC